MERKFEFWLNCLSEDVRERWLKNYDDVYSSMSLSDFLKKEMKIQFFILEAFSWLKTSEGTDFWEKFGIELDEDKLIQHQRNKKLKQLGL